MVTDYEAAWTRLAAFVAAKTQHGREGLLSEMARLAEDCRVPAGELSRLLRLHGVEVERVRSLSTESGRVGSGAFDGGFGSSADAADAGHHRTKEVHDGGHSNGAARAAA